MTDTEEFLKLIEEGNAIEILEKENLTQNLDILHELDLIKLQGDVIRVTPRGREIRTEGIREVQQQSLAGKVSRKASKAYKIFLWLLMISVLIFAISLLIMG